MIHLLQKLFIIIAVCGAYQSAFAKSAELNLYPTRIVLENNENTATMALKNTGDATGNYRIEVINMSMSETGSIDEVPDEKAEFSAKRMLRISPRSINLGSNQDQNIRIMIRKPQGAEDGEYRAHIKVTMTDDNVAEGGGPRADGDTNSIGITIKAHLTLVVPIIIRYGKTSYTTQITDATYHVATLEGGQKVPTVDMGMSRTGNRSTMGDIDITYIDPQGKKTVVKHLAGIPIYRPLEHRKISLPLDIPEGVTIGKGTLHITYRAQEEEKNVLLSEKDITL